MGLRRLRAGGPQSAHPERDERDAHHPRRERLREFGHDGRLRRMPGRHLLYHQRCIRPQQQHVGTGCVRLGGCRNRQHLRRVRPER